MDAGSSAIFSSERNKFMTVLWKCIELLEQMRRSSVIDSRPKHIRSLRNVVSPLCNVIFFSNVARVLRDIYNETGSQILLKGLPSEVSFSVTELLDKICKGVLSKAYKERRIVLLANSGSSQFTEIQRKITEWKKTKFSKISKTVSEKGTISALIEACILSVNLDAESLIDMLKSNEFVQIDSAGRVKYAFPNVAGLKSAQSELKSKFLDSWAEETSFRGYGYQHEVEEETEMEIDERLNELMIHTILHLQRMDNHKPKTEKGLRHALKPVLSLLYIASPKSVLQSFLPRHRCRRAPNPDSFSVFMHSSERPSDKITFQRASKKIKKLIPLHSVIPEIGSAFSKKQTISSGFQATDKKNLLKPPRKRNFVNAFTGGRQQLSTGNGFYVFSKLLLYVERKAQHMNRSVVFSSAKQETHCKVMLRKLLLVDSTEERCNKAQLLDKVSSGMSVDTDMLESNAGHSPQSQDLGNATGNGQKTLSSIKKLKSKNKCTSLSVTEVLAILQTVAVCNGQLDPDFLIELLAEAGYCSVEGNSVSYRDTFPKEYQETLKGSLTHVLKSLCESFDLDMNSKLTRPQRKLRHLRKRPRYQ